MDPSTINKLVTPIMELFQERMSGSSLVLLHQETMLVVFLQVVLVHCTFQTADVSFRVARMLLVEHTVTMHEVEPSAGDVELYEFLKIKMKEDSEIYEECNAYNYAVNKQREEQEQYFDSQLWGQEGGQLRGGQELRGEDRHGQHK